LGELRMGIRNAAQYLASLRAGREFYIDGKCVSDGTDRPAFRRGA
jgi:aromatic ring hydroxylase